MLPAILLFGLLPITGVVFQDLNGDGVRQPAEPPLVGVVVSNQDEVVRTDAQGRFALNPARGTGIVFVSVPDGYRASGAFWQPVPGDGAPLAFGLIAAPAASSWSFVHASDTHISPDSRPRTARLRELVDSLQPAFVLITGDLVRDALRVGEAEATGYYRMFLEERARFSRPVWTVPGNHEIFGVERQRSRVTPDHPLYERRMYRQYLGPDYYSFTYGGVHFVGLNSLNVDDQWYYGNVDSLQLAWLARDVATVPDSQPVVTFNHVPFFSAAESLHGYTESPPAPSVIAVNGRLQFRHTVSNARAVLGVLRARRHPLALAGHIHLGERLAFAHEGQSTRFENAPAIVGPGAGGGFAFPSGFSVYRVRAGRIASPELVRLDPPSRTPDWQ